ncbi:hypothetical protein FB451DRAFT_1570328 [Mycena latifolia]|nr:hypothetical protein FB451DRAFT_1570328 [Mycena latifolia]
MSDIGSFLPSFFPTTHADAATTSLQTPARTARWGRRCRVSAEEPKGAEEISPLAPPRAQKGDASTPTSGVRAVQW